MLFAQAQHNTIQHKATTRERKKHEEKKEKWNEKKMTHNDGAAKAKWFQVDSIFYNKYMYI